MLLSTVVPVDDGEDTDVRSVDETLVHEYLQLMSLVVGEDLVVFGVQQHLVGVHVLGPHFHGTVVLFMGCVMPWVDKVC